MGSALYYQGAIEKEPECLSIATKRTDRSLINMNFPVNRHYFSESNFEIGLKKEKTEFGCYYIYDIERSVCDVIRFQSGNIDEVITGVCRNEYQYKRLLEYAKLLRIKRVY